MCGRARMGSAVNAAGTGLIDGERVSRSATNPRPDGKKKAYVRLTADFDALEIANKVSRTIPTSSAQVLTSDRLHLKTSHDHRVTLYLSL